MQSSVWRLGSRIVAVMDLALLTLAVPILILALVLPGSGSEFAHLDTDNTLNSTFYELNVTQSSESKLGTRLNDHDNVTVMVYGILGVGVVIYVAMNAIQAWAAVELLMAARVAEEPERALDMAQFWIIISCNVYFLGYRYIGSLALRYMPALIILLVYRSISFYVVVKFIQALRSRLNSGNNQPDSVVYRKIAEM